MLETNEEPVFVYNLRVLFFNWLPAIGCLAAGVIGLVAGAAHAEKGTTGGGLYLVAAAIGFAMFGWVWRR
ncbi:MAG TPA: hypothetical protein VLM40_02765 [Gemmata sp.]|nr:hypothetical protein [Gemmata sp.]